MPNSRDTWSALGSGGLSDAYETLQPTYVPETAARDAFMQTSAANRAFYDQNFRDEAMRIRNIGLGFGAGNGYTAAQDAVKKSGSIFSNTQDMFARDTQRQGRVVDAGTQQSQTQRMGLARIIAQVDAGNRAIKNADTTRKNAQMMGTQLYGDATGAAGGILGRLAAGETDRENQNRQYIANGNSNQAQSAMGGVGAILSMI